MSGARTPTTGSLFVINGCCRLPLRRMLRFIASAVCLVLCIASSKIHFENNDVSCRSSSKCMSLPKCTPYMDLLYASERPLKRPVVDFLRSQQCGFENPYPKVCCAPLPKTIPIYIPKKVSVSVSAAAESSGDKGQSSSAPQTTLTTTQKPVKKKKFEEKKIDMEKAFEDFYDDVYMFDVLRNTPEDMYFSDVEIR